MMKYLLAHNYAPNMEIIKAGSPGDAMYFIASGEVLLKSNHGDVTLTTGEFFGEIAMLENEDYEFPYSTVSKLQIVETGARMILLYLSGSHPKDWGPYPSDSRKTHGMARRSAQRSR